MPVASLRGAHLTWAWIVILANGGVGVWALAAHWLLPLRHRAVWWCTAAAQLTIFVQVGIGAVLRSDVAARSQDRFHEFYGFIAIVAIAILYSYRSQLRHQIYLLYGLGSLFVMGLAIRAMVLA